MAANSPSAKATPSPRLTEYVDNQERLPYWARSTNPIVRRHLGLYWRTLPPEIQPFLVILTVWSVLLGIGILFPPFFSATMITFLASILVIPLTMAIYVHVLVTVSISATQAMQQEFSNNTFELLRATPMTLAQIFMGKVASALWKRMDDIIMVAQLGFAFTPPIAFTIYSDFFPRDEYTIVAAPVLTLIAAIVTMLRIFLEPLMIGVVSVFVGMVVPGKGRSISAALVVGAFYFLLINLISRLPQVRGFESPEGPVPANNMLIILTDFVLPIALPIIIIFGILKLAEATLESD